jgi:hypothetical protein
LPSWTPNWNFKLGIQYHYITFITTADRCAASLPNSFRDKHHGIYQSSVPFLIPQTKQTPHNARPILYKTLLSIRSPQELIQQCTKIALRLAVLGHISQSVTLIDLAPQLGHLEHRFPSRNGLYYTWETISSWPFIVPEDHRTTEFLKQLDENGRLNNDKWTHPWSTHPNNQFERLSVDEVGLQRLLEFVGGEGGSGGELKYAHDEKYDMSASRAGAVCMALDFALRIGGHEDVVQKLMPIITEDVGYLHEVAKSRSVWVLLKDGCLAEKWNDREDVSSEFEATEDCVHRTHREWCAETTEISEDERTCAAP